MSEPTAATCPITSLLGCAVEIHLATLTLSALLAEIRRDELLVCEPVLEGSAVRLPAGSRVRLLADHAGECWEVLAEVDSPQDELENGVRLRCRSAWRPWVPRRAPRTDRRLAVEIISGQPGDLRRVLCVTRNISEAGFAALFDPEAELTPGLQAEAHLFLSVHQPPLRVTARCVRRRALAGRLRGRMEVGFEFTDLGEAQRVALRQTLSGMAAG
ncbi:MAG: PilZ domain-containing protein [Armatimonadetes bacterium]|nr:PilZ domain-containing protein [Armatimonadota bacterium]